MRTRTGESGQVEAETAIVMPLFVFLMLGLIQLGLLHQARLIAKYAAYRAVRAGALRNAKVDVMESAAVAASLPILSWAHGNTEVIGKTSTGQEWREKYMKSQFKNNMMQDVSLPYAQIVICGPKQQDVQAGVYTVSGQKYVSFDNPKLAGEGIKSKLRVMLTLNYRMLIPFADWVIYRSWRGFKLPAVLHMGKGGQEGYGAGDAYDAAAEQGVHIIPIFTEYSMKLHSDVLLSDLPTSNNCL